MEISEKKLIMAAVDGDMHAFEDLLRIYEKKIYGIAFKVARNESDAFDISQEVALKLYRKLDTFKFDAKFSTWLYRLAMNTSIDEYRKLKRKRDREFSYDQSNGDQDTNLKDTFKEDGPTPEELLIKDEEKQDLWFALNELSDNSKTIIIMKDFEGLSYIEISEGLGISIGTVKSRLARARNNLKNELLKKWNKGETNSS